MPPLSCDGQRNIYLELSEDGVIYAVTIELNQAGLIAGTIDKHVLHDIVSEYLDLMETSSAIYEKNGDYAYGIFSSKWCRLMDQASRNLCHTEDNSEALKCGKWLCHESCWTSCSKQAIDTRTPTDIECNGGVRLYAVPIFAGEEVIGAINFGYGDPPKENAKLMAIADSYGLDVEELVQEANNYDTRPLFIVEMAKRRLQATARLIGIMVERKQSEVEKSKIEIQLQQAQKLESLGILAGGIAHDFNNILTGIMGNISFAKVFLDATHTSYKPLAEAEKASARAGELAHQLLTFARGGEPVKKLTSLRKIVEESVSLVLHGSNVNAVIDIPDSMHAIEADEGQMSQVFHNIIINATQAMPGGGTLKIAAQNKILSDNNAFSLPPGPYIYLTFADQGCGISDEDRIRIFDPYFTTKSSGNGLGLASVHSIINRHGGHIGVSSVVGKGTTFTIYLPSFGDIYKEHHTGKSSHTTGERKGGHILVMDDEEMVRDIATMMITHLGYEVTTCANGEKAVELYKTSMESGMPFVAVVMDLTIPGGLGGKEAAEQILSLFPKACLIVSSGYSNDPIMSNYREYGFSRAIAKPYNLNKLAQTLESLG